MQHLPPQPPGSQVTQSLLVVPYEVLHDSNHLRDQSKSQALENKDYRTQLPTSFPRNILGVHSFDIAVHELRTQETSFAGQVLNLTAAALALRTPRTPEIHSFSD